MCPQFINWLKSLIHNIRIFMLFLLVSSLHNTNTYIYVEKVVLFISLYDLANVYFDRKKITSKFMFVVVMLPCVIQLFIWELFMQLWYKFFHIIFYHSCIMSWYYFVFCSSPSITQPNIYLTFFLFSLSIYLNRIIIRTINLQDFLGFLLHKT